MAETRLPPPLLRPDARYLFHPGHCVISTPALLSPQPEESSVPLNRHPTAKSRPSPPQAW